MDICEDRKRVDNDYVPTGNFGCLAGDKATVLNFLTLSEEDLGTILPQHPHRVSNHAKVTGEPPLGISDSAT